MIRSAREMFGFLAWRWSVDHAKRIVADGRAPVHLDPRGMRGWVETIKRGEPSGEVDLAVPVIAIRTVAAGLMPIDGYNRLGKALGAGRERLPFHVLSAAEERAIRMTGCPWRAFEAAEERARVAAARGGG